MAEVCAASTRSYRRWCSPVSSGPCLHGLSRAGDIALTSSLGCVVPRPMCAEPWTGHQYAELSGGLRRLFFWATHPRWNAFRIIPELEAVAIASELRSHRAVDRPHDAAAAAAEARWDLTRRPRAEGDAAREKDRRQRQSLRRKAEAEVGTAGFEPATPSTPRKCATGLRYVPPQSFADSGESIVRSMAAYNSRVFRGFEWVDSACAQSEGRRGVFDPFRQSRGTRQQRSGRR